MFLGIDLSCYTTSCAVADGQGKIVYDGRKLLSVPKNEKGLRQSEMVFSHIKNLKDVFPAGFLGVRAVAVSERPRPIAGSYMPVFTAAYSYADVVAKSLGVPLYALTHQHGQIASALINNEVEGELLALHVSGGTTDVLKVCVSDGVVGKITGIGRASDISAGMFIDRIGVKLGCKFPCGGQLEAMSNDSPISIPSRILGLNASFSGAQTAAQRLIDEGADAAGVAAGVLRCCANTLEKLIRKAVFETGIKRVLLFGGVMCNGIIRKRLSERLPYELFFADKKYSSDNACGLAIQAKKLYERGIENGSS